MDHKNMNVPQPQSHRMADYEEKFKLTGDNLTNKLHEIMITSQERVDQIIQTPGLVYFTFAYDTREQMHFLPDILFKLIRKNTIEKVLPTGLFVRVRHDYSYDLEFEHNYNVTKYFYIRLNLPSSRDILTQLIFDGETLYTVNMKRIE